MGAVAANQKIVSPVGGSDDIIGKVSSVQSGLILNPVIETNKGFDPDPKSLRQLPRFLSAYHLVAAGVARSDRAPNSHLAFVQFFPAAIRFHRRNATSFSNYLVIGKFQNVVFSLRS